MHRPHLGFLLPFLFICANQIVLASSSTDFSQHPWIAPGPNDLRGPCPGLNTLANHGFLPRDGRNLTPPLIVDAASSAYNVNAEVIALAAKVGLTTTDVVDSFTLEDIKLHNNIEHDASVSRQDFFFGDNFHFNGTIYNQTMAMSNPGFDFYNATSAGQVMIERLADSKSRNPTIINTGKELAIRTRESSLYLSVMGNVTSGTAKKTFVNIFFREERLPLEEGWVRSPVEINAETIQPLDNTIFDFAFEQGNWTASNECESIKFVLTANGSFTV